MDDVASMIGYRPLPLMKWCWAVVTPLVCVVSGDMRVRCHGHRAPLGGCFGHGSPGVTRVSGPWSDTHGGFWGHQPPVP